MTDGIDAPVYRMQPITLHPVPDRVPANSKSDELSAGHDSVLAVGDLGDRRINRVEIYFRHLEPAYC